MAVEFPINAAIVKLRAAVKAAFSIPDGNPIPESGNDPTGLNITRLPMAVLERDGPAAVESGPAVKDRTTRLVIHCWLIRQKTGGSPDLQSLRTALSALGSSLYADPTLDGTVTTLEVLEMDESGTGRTPLIPIDPSQGAHSGYVTVELQLTETL